MLKKLKQKTATRKRVSLESEDKELFEEAMERKARKLNSAVVEAEAVAETGETGETGETPEPEGVTPEAAKGPRYVGALLQQKKLRDAERKASQIAMQRKHGAGLVVFESDTYIAMAGPQTAAASPAEAGPGPARIPEQVPGRFSSKVLPRELLRARERYFERINQSRVAV